jgi:hypothetical protein
MKTQDSDRSQGEYTAGANGTDALGERVADVGRKAASAAKRQTETLLGGAKRGATDAANSASGTIDAVAGSLADSGQETLSRTAAALSGRLHDFAGYLEGRSLNELAQDAQRMARRNPALFVAGGLALGFALSRFFKASAGGASQNVSSRTH